MSSPGRRPFLPRTTSSPYPTSHSPATARVGRKGPNKNNTSFLFCQHSISNPSTPLVIRTWWTSSTGYVTDLELPPPPAGGGGRLWLERRVAVAYCAGLLSPAVRTDHPGNVHFSQNPCHSSPHPRSQCPAMVGADRIGLSKRNEDRPLYSILILCFICITWYYLYFRT